MKASFLTLAIALISVPMTVSASPATDAGETLSCRAALIRLTIGARQAAFAKADVTNKAREIQEMQSAIERNTQNMSSSPLGITPFDQDILRIQRKTVEVNQTTLEMLKTTQASKETALNLLISIAEGNCLIEGAKNAPKR